MGDTAAAPSASGESRENPSSEEPAQTRRGGDAVADALTAAPAIEIGEDEVSVHRAPATAQCQPVNV